MSTSERTQEKAAIPADSGAAHELGAKPAPRLKRFAGLGPARQMLLLRALFVVGAIRLGLCLLPFRGMQRFARRIGTKSNVACSADQYVWAVRAVSRYVPGATCLTQALAAQALLARSGHESHIELGVRKDEQSRFLAHAWVVCGDRIVIGGAGADDYLPLKNWEPRPAGIDKT
jgi:hypothetical protein